MNKYNSEGYHDPTAYAAFRAIEREEKAKAKQYHPIVYIASPFAGDTKRNIEQARKYCRFAVRQQCIPLAPHLLFPQFMNDRNPAERELALRFALILLGKCSELWVFGESISQGMAAEIKKARWRNMPIKYYSEKCEVKQLGTQNLIR